MKLIHKRKHNNKNAYLFMLPSLAACWSCLLIPYFDVMRRSFMDGTGRKFVGTENYEIVFSNQAFQLAAGNTARFIAVCVPLLILLSLLIAIMAAEK